MLSPLPRRSGWATFAHSTQPYQPSPKGLSGRSAHRPFRGLLDRYGLHTRAVTVFRDTLTEGFSHFVTSIAWSDWFAPTGERRLGTAHTPSGHFGDTMRLLPPPDAVTLINFASTTDFPRSNINITSDANAAPRMPRDVSQLRVADRGGWACPKVEGASGCRFRALPFCPMTGGSRG